MSVKGLVPHIVALQYTREALEYGIVFIFDTAIEVKHEGLEKEDGLPAGISLCNETSITGITVSEFSLQ